MAVRICNEEGVKKKKKGKKERDADDAVFKKSKQKDGKREKGAWNAAHGNVLGLPVLLNTLPTQFV